ncbi:ECF transporter S component [Mycoplasmatota bacterium]|nr:ECF transporter S component [Mycoplasmatota bacterium]
MENLFQFLQANDLIVRLVLAGIFILGLVALVYYAYKMENKKMTNAQKIKKMTLIAILSALSVGLYFFPKISISVFLPFMPAFLELHFSNLPIYVGGFLLGPISGSIIVVIRFISKLPASSTMGTGELLDFIIGLSTVLVSSMIYAKHKTKHSAKISLLWITIIWTFVAVLSNWLFILPLYIELFGFNVIFGMLSVIPGITTSNYMLFYLLIAIVPFNIILSSIVSTITYFVYKRVSHIYHDISFSHHPNESQQHIEKK